jgi:hypothetical protein
MWPTELGLKSLKQTTIMGRPPVLPKKKKDGFYLELRNKGAKSGIIVIRDTKEAMMQAARQYENTKDVIILGEHKNGKKVDEARSKKAVA